MAKRKNQNVEAEVVDTEVVAKVRKSKLDYIPDDMMDEFNALQEALVAQKSQTHRAVSKLTPEQMAEKAEKLRKKIAALEAAMNI